MSRPDARAERVDRLRNIAESLFGAMISAGKSEAVIEVPADVLSGAMNALSMSGFRFVIGKQDARMAPRRVVDMAGRTIVCQEQDLMAFMEITVQLAESGARVEAAPHAVAIQLTRPTGPTGQ